MSEMFRAGTANRATLLRRAQYGGRKGRSAARRLARLNKFRARLSISIRGYEITRELHAFLAGLAKDETHP